MLLCALRDLRGELSFIRARLIVLPVSQPAAPPPIDVREARAGLAYGLAAYLSWGLAPAYYHLLDGVPPVQILAHRIFWSVLLLLPLVVRRRLWREIGHALRDRRTLLTLVASTACITSNWYTFIYAVSVNKVMESSLGYYMNPLVVVLLGVVFLKERLRPWQVISLALAACAVALLTLAQGRLPAITLILAVSFALYGLLRKTAGAGAVVGLFIETVLLLPIALTIIGRDAASRGLHWTPGIYALLAGAGVITAVPLLWFANAARRLRLATLGLLQYLTPTCSFLLAVAFFNEPFTPAQKVAFPMIWAALAIYTVDSYRAFRAATRAAPAQRYIPYESAGDASAARFAATAAGAVTAATAMTTSSNPTTPRTHNRRTGSTAPITSSTGAASSTSPSTSGTPGSG
jgi:chloramphenicol-sensitive protein RarD